MGRRFALGVALATSLVGFGDLAFAQDVYIGQMDANAVRQPTAHAASSAEGAASSVYIEQLPSSARPKPVRVKRRAGAAQVGARTARRVLPDVGAGVTLAVPAGARDRAFPNVRKGTIGG